MAAAGGWEKAARLPVVETLAWADHHLSDKVLEAFRHAQSCHFSALPLFAMGGKPPDPPVLPPDYQ